ncbi:phage tail domain-containing protein [Streptomyces graminilatus]|uniref:phage tail domain-containing protein n=1 Tax=Streptomyces graminilatus TaxID=1464070 RepID=UPI0006E14AB9|nr:phage tail domain-containing protein [Streptomyces graminilatus]
MPIPARPLVPVNGAFARNPSVPVPEDWQNTYVSIKGANGQGEEIPLTGFLSASWPAIMLQPGATGLDMPPFELHTDDSPNLDGSMFRGARAATRQILLPLFVYGIDRKTLRSFKRKLANALNPKLGYCVLTFVESDGVSRHLQCYYAGGMEGNESVDSAGFRWISYGIQLNAVDPWFYGDKEFSDRWAFGAPQAFLGNPFFPLTLGHSTVTAGTIQLTNPGDIEAWPIWTLTGPLKSFEFTGPDGTSWGIPARLSGVDALLSHRTLTVDCRPGYKTVKDDEGTNYFSLLSPNPSLWSVPPGKSTVQADLVAGSGTPSVSVSLIPRYTSY